MESTQILSLVLAFASVVASTICSCVAIKMARKRIETAVSTSIDIANRYYKFQFFSEYTRRYQDLILHSPCDFHCLSISNEKEKTFMQLYFDLCSEEFYLHNQGVIDDHVWNLWVEGMKAAMIKQNFQAAWKYLAQLYDDQNFIHFMNNIDNEH